MGAVIKDPEEKLKHIIVGEDLLPQAVALDPDLLLGLPAPVTAATGIDALTHGIEAYICIWDRGTRKENGRLAIQGVFPLARAGCAASRRCRGSPGYGGGGLPRGYRDQPGGCW